MRAHFSIEYHEEKIELHTIGELCELQEVIAGLIAGIAQHRPDYVGAFAERFGYPRDEQGNKLGIMKARFELTS